MQEAKGGAVRIVEARPIGLCPLQEDKGSLDIGPDECLRGNNGAVYMALCCKMNNGPRPVFCED